MKKLFLISALTLITASAQAKTVAIGKMMISPGISRTTSDGTYIAKVNLSEDTYPKLTADTYYYISADANTLNTICAMLGKTKVVKYHSLNISNAPIANSLGNSFKLVENSSGEVMDELLCGQ